MPKFIEFHIFHSGIPVYVNVESTKGFGKSVEYYTMYSDRNKQVSKLFLN